MPYDKPKGSGIYAITCVPTGKRYVGSAVDLASRWRVHRHHLNKGTHHSQKLLNAWRKYGEVSFSFSVLLQIELKEYLVPEEQRFMNELKPELNMSMTAGSCLGNRATPEQRQRMCEAQKMASVKRRWFYDNRAPMSEETKQKLRIARSKQVISKGYKWTEAQRLNSSRRRKGKPAPWNLGRKFTSEHKAKLSSAKLGKKRKPYTEETCRRISLAKRGKKRPPVSDETRAKLSKAITQLWKNKLCPTTQTI